MEPTRWVKPFEKPISKIKSLLPLLLAAHLLNSHDEITRLTVQRRAKAINRGEVNPRLLVMPNLPAVRVGKAAPLRQGKGIGNASLLSKLSDFEYHHNI